MKRILAIILAFTISSGVIAGTAPETGQNPEELAKAVEAIKGFGRVQSAHFDRCDPKLLFFWYDPFSGRAACYIHGYYYDAERKMWIRFLNELVDGPHDLSVSMPDAQGSVVTFDAKGWEGLKVDASKVSVTSAHAANESIERALKTIQKRLAELKDKYPELSGIAEVKLRDSGLYYDNKGGCRLQVQFNYPAAAAVRAKGDEGIYSAAARLNSSFFLHTNSANPDLDPFDKAVRSIVREETQKLVTEICQARLDPICRLLKDRTGGKWAPDTHNGFCASWELMVRGRVYDTSGKNIEYTVLPIGAADEKGPAKILGWYGNLRSKPPGDVSIIGAGPDFTVLEIRRGKDDDAARDTRAALKEELKLSAPRITLEMFRPVLDAAEKALADAAVKANPDSDPSKRPSIAIGQEPDIQERDGALRFVWEHITSTKTSSYRVVVERAKDGKISVLEVKLGL